MISLLFVSCEDIEIDFFQYSPKQAKLKEHEKNLTARNLEKILQQSAEDTIRLILMGDTQRFYDEADDFVKAANSIEEIDFVVHLGDISDFGMAQEFRWMHDIMKNLKVPYLTVIGNHDMLASGRTAYQQMYGAFNYAFVYGETKFIFLDTNGREYGFNGKVPDIDWLQSQLVPAGEWKQAVVISHVKPFSGDFDDNLSLPYHQALVNSKMVDLSLHGHDHDWGTTYGPDSLITYQVTTTMKKRAFSYLKIWNRGYRIERRFY